MMDPNNATKSNNATTDLTGATLSVRVTYAGMAWVGVAISPDGKMMGSSAVIGLPNVTTYYDDSETMMDGNVSQYHLGTFAQQTNIGTSWRMGAGVVPQQTLLDFNMTQSEENGTVLEFSRSLLDDDGGNTTVHIDPYGFNYILLAHGEDNILGYHGAKNRISLNVSFLPCLPEDGDLPNATSNVDGPIIFDDTPTTAEVDKGQEATPDEDEPPVGAEPPEGALAESSSAASWVVSSFHIMRQAVFATALMTMMVWLPL